MDDVATALAAENRRLRREAKHLEERLRAVESSRWYRLNPRRAWRRAAGRRRPAEATTDDHPPDRAATATGAISADAAGTDLARFEEEVVRRGRFSRAWAIRSARPWEPVFEALEGR